jgi:hypothetical protein
MKFRFPIVIIDEGHNMADVCRDGASFLVSQRTLNSVVGQLLGCKESTSSGLYDNLLDLAKGLQVWFKKKVDVLQSMRSSSSGGGGGRGSGRRGVVVAGRNFHEKVLSSGSAGVTLISLWRL